MLRHLFRTPLARGLTACLALAALLGPAQAQQGTTVESSPRKFFSEGLDGVNLDGLTAEQRDLALKVLNDVDCHCGCGMSVARCRVDDRTCPRSPALARAVVDAVRRGGDEGAVREAYRAIAAATGGRRGVTGPPEPGQAVSVSLEGAAIRGDADAPVTIVEFSDFQCPYCARSAPLVRSLLEEYDGKVRLAFKHLPLPFHGQARLAAAAAEAAGKQGKFWEMHDLLFQDPKALSREAILGYAAELGLDAARFEAALNDPGIGARIDGDLAEAQRLGVTGTPTFFINGERLPNPQAQTFRRAIDRALLRAATETSGGS